MDAITQLQDYVRMIFTLYANTAESMMEESPSVGPDGLPDDELSTRLGNTAAQIMKLHQECRLLHASRLEIEYCKVSCGCVPFGSGDLLMASLPASFASEESQLQLLSDLQTQNEAAGQRLAKARADAGMQKPPHQIIGS